MIPIGSDASRQLRFKQSKAEQFIDFIVKNWRTYYLFSNNIILLRLINPKTQIIVTGLYSSGVE